jgi:hypothetical protein
MSKNPNYSNLSQTEIANHSFDPTNDAVRVEDQSLVPAIDPVYNAVRVENIAQLVPQIYDSLTLSYIASGNGSGQIGTVNYYVGGLSGTLVSSLTLSYDSSNRLISVVNSVEQ